jgi:sugar-specific transcriptional regulator TrmB
MAKRTRQASTVASPAGAQGNGEVRTETAELVRLLGEMGLAVNEARVYLALLELETPTAAEAATRADVPRPKVYEALEGLESRGFCSSMDDGVRRFRAFPPDAALRGWVRHRDHERAAAAERDQVTAQRLVELLPTPPERAFGSMPEYIEAISGRVQTTEALEEFVGAAQESLLMMFQPPFLQPRPRWNVAELEAARRGVEVRVIFTPEALSDPRRYEGLSAGGAEIRVLPALPMKLTVRDGTEALISLRDANTGEQSIATARVRHPDLVAPLAVLFNENWRDAQPLDEYLAG